MAKQNTKGAKAAKAQPAGPTSAPSNPNTTADQTSAGAAAPAPEPDAAINLDGLAKRFATKRQPEPPPAEDPLKRAPQPEPGEPGGEEGEAPHQAPAGDGNAPAGEDQNLEEPNPQDQPPKPVDAVPADDEPGNQPPNDEPPPKPDDENPTADLKLPPEIQEKVNQRISQVVAERNQAREQAQAAERRIADLNDALSAANQAQNPAAHLANMEAVEEMAAQMRALRRWAKQHPEGGELRNEKGEVTEYDAQQVARISENAEDWLEEHLPRQAKFLARREEFDRQTREIFPWMGDANHRDRKEAEEVLAALPELQRYPHANWIAAVAVLGMKEYRRMRAAQAGTGKGNGHGNGATAPGLAPARIATRPAAAPAPEPRRQEEMKALKAAQEFERTGSTDALAARFAANRKARMQTA